MILYTLQQADLIYKKSPTPRMMQGPRGLSSKGLVL